MNGNRIVINKIFIYFNYENKHNIMFVIQHHFINPHAYILPLILMLLKMNFKPQFKES